jgi:two-component system KDP operon response regulator KdpE
VDLRGPRGERQLTRLESGVLMALYRSGRVVSHQELLTQLWGEEFASQTRLLYDTVSRLRLALASVGAPEDAIETHHGFGYRLRRG